MADAAALAVLHGAGLSVLSEESGLTGPGGLTGRAVRADGSADGLLVVVDPVDGSTNASLGLPWYTTSLCALDAEGPRVALVVNQASGVRYEAVRGQGQLRNGESIAPSGCRQLEKAVIGVSGAPAASSGLGTVPSAGIGRSGPLRRRRGAL